ncbi:MAG: hypothetical protein PHY16_05920 [Methylobacter sp.]|nr:hypothetical protein [Methylobacter sp.]
MPVFLYLEEAKFYILQLLANSTLSDYMIHIFQYRHSGMDARTHPPGADGHLPLGVRGRIAPHESRLHGGFKLAIPGAWIPASRRV